MDKWVGWHWLIEDRRLQFPPHTLVEPGQVLKADGELELCVNGMHASRRAIDALQYAPGPVVCRVELDGEIIEGFDKACARRRRCLWMADATAVLHEFACQCAEEALREDKVTDPIYWVEIDEKRMWLKEVFATNKLSTAIATACDTARAASWDAKNDLLESMLFQLQPKE